RQTIVVEIRTWDLTRSRIRRKRRSCRGVERHAGKSTAATDQREWVLQCEGAGKIEPHDPIKVRGVDFKILCSDVRLAVYQRLHNRALNAGPNFVIDDALLLCCEGVVCSLALWR